MNEDLLVGVGVTIAFVLCMYWSKRFWDLKERLCEVEGANWSSKRITH